MVVSSGHGLETGRVRLLLPISSPWRDDPPNFAGQPARTFAAGLRVIDFDRCIMAFRVIPLDFNIMYNNYKDFKSLPVDVNTWLVGQNDQEKKTNADNAAWNLANPDKKPRPKVHISTSCAMQASLSFNASDQPIPKSGSVDRDNLKLDAEKYYILSVAEFRSYLTYKYGSTDEFAAFSDLKGMQGVLIIDDLHVEFWDGDDVLQSAAGAAKRNGNIKATMNPAFLEKRPRWFWQIGKSDSWGGGSVPDWARGWWEVYDTNYYYYFFGSDEVVYIKTKPNPKWTPDKSVGNHGTVTATEHGVTVRWRPLPGAETGTREDFTRVGWTSETQMNGVSSKYGPLFANKLKTS